MTEIKKKRDLGFKLEDLLREGERAAAAMGTAMGQSPDLAKRNSLAVTPDSLQGASFNGKSASSMVTPRETPVEVPAPSPAEGTTKSSPAKGRPRQDLRNPDQICRTVLYLSEDLVQIAKIKAIEGNTRPSVIIDDILRRCWLG
jgi:hypothetical protein